MDILSYVADYEKDYDKKLDVKVLRFVGHLDRLGKAFEEKGREDAAKRLLILQNDAFLDWSKKHIKDDPEIAESVGELMRYCYMDGYEEGSAVCTRFPE